LRDSEQSSQVNLDTPVGVHDPVDPYRIPVPSVHLAELEASARSLKRIGKRVAQSSGDLDGDWRGLSAFYRAPESARLIAATRDIPVTGEQFEHEAKTIGDALLAFVDEVRPIVERLHGVRSAAIDFRAKLDADWDGDFGSWRKNGEWVKENNRLNDAAMAALIQYQAAERACANKITGLFGGTRFRPHAAWRPRGEYAYGWVDMPKGSPTPWGLPQVRDKPWYEDVGDGAHHFAQGLLYFGLDMIGAHEYGESPDTTPTGRSMGDWFGRLKSNWSGIADDVFTLGGQLTGRVDENGVSNKDLTAGQWWNNVKDGWKNLANSMVPWQEWDDRPGYVLGSGFLNVGSLAYGGAKGVSTLNKGLRDLRGTFQKSPEQGPLSPPPQPAPPPRFGFTEIDTAFTKPRALVTEGELNVPQDRLDADEIMPDKGMKPDHPVVLGTPAQVNTATAADKLAQINVHDLAESLRANPGAASAGGAASVGAAAGGSLGAGGVAVQPAAGLPANIPAAGSDVPPAYINPPQPHTTSTGAAGPTSRPETLNAPLRQESQPPPIGAVPPAAGNASGQPMQTSSSGDRPPAHMPAPEPREIPGSGRPALGPAQAAQAAEAPQEANAASLSSHPAGLPDEILGYIAGRYGDRAEYHGAEVLGYISERYGDRVLYHGSANLIHELEPRQQSWYSRTTKKRYPDGPPAIAAADRFDIPIFMALFSGRRRCTYSMNPDGSVTFTVREALTEEARDLNNLTGYVHVLARDQFELFHGTAPEGWPDPEVVRTPELRAYVPVRPIVAVRVGIEDFPHTINFPGEASGTG
jgi:hypothetical protein